MDKIIETSADEITFEISRVSEMMDRFDKLVDEIIPELENLLEQYKEEKNPRMFLIHGMLVDAYKETLSLEGLLIDYIDS